MPRESGTFPELDVPSADKPGQDLGFVQRHRGKLVTLAVFALGFVSGMAAMSWQSWRNRDLADLHRHASETNLVNGILRSIGHDHPDWEGPAELQGLIDWSSLKDDRLKLLVFERGLANPVTAIRLCRRIERVLQACIGISNKRRTMAAKLANRFAMSESADPDVQFVAARLALEIGDAEPNAVTLAIRNFGQRDLAERSDFFDEFLQLAITQSRNGSLALEPAQLNSLLIELSERATNWQVREGTGQGFLELAGTLNASAAKDSLPILLDMAGREMKGDGFNAAAYGVCALICRLDMAETEWALQSIIDLAAKTTNDDALWASANCFMDLAERLDHMQAERAWNSLAAMAKKSTDMAKYAVASGFTALAPRLSASQSEWAWESLAELPGQRHGDHVLECAERGFAALADKLEGPQTEMAMQVLMKLADQTTDRQAMNGIMIAFKELAAKLDAQQTERAWIKTIELTGQPPGTTSLYNAPAAVRELAVHMEPARSEQAWNSLIQLVRKPADWPAVRAAGAGFTVLAEKLDPAQTERALQSLIELTADTQSIDVFESAVAGFKGLAGKLDAAQSVRAWNSLIEIMERSEKLEEWRETAAECLPILAVTLENSETEWAWRSLINQIRRSPARFITDNAKKGMTILSQRLDPAQVRQIVSLLLEQAETSVDEGELNAVGLQIQALAGKLDRSQVDRALQAFADRIDGSSTESSLAVSADAIAALADHLDSGQTERAWDLMIKVVRKSGSRYTCWDASRAISALAGRLDVGQVENAWGSLVELAKVSEYSSQLDPVEAGFLALGPRLDETQSRKAWQSLIDMSSVDTSISFSQTAAICFRHALKGELSELQAKQALRVLIETDSRDGETDCPGICISYITDCVHADARSRCFLAAIWMQLDSLSRCQSRLETRDVTSQAAQLSDPREIVAMLDHPGAIGEMRACLLQRLEEIVIHGGRPVYTQLDAEWPEESVWNKLSEAEQEHWQARRDALPPREFRTIYDAAVWLDANRPDIVAGAATISR